MKNFLRTIKYASWLGWQIESNWANPWLFAVYSVIRPIASSLILVFMYYVVTGGKTQTDFFAFLFIGNAVFMFIGGALEGISRVIFMDREYFEVLKYIYLSPISIYAYLFGRGAARMAATAVAVIITLLFGKVALHLNISLFTINYPELITAFFLGIVGVEAFGIILSAFSMITAWHNFSISAAWGGVFYFLSGVVFPINVLPPALQLTAKLIPFTYWVEAMRRGLMPGLHLNKALSGFSNVEIFGILAATSLVLLAISVAIFSWVDHLVRRKGTIDMVTTH